MVRNSSILFLNPSASASQTRLCKYTRTTLKPMLSAQPNSRSMVFGSQVSACHISNSLMAVLGIKLHPINQGCWLYHSFAWLVVHIFWDQVGIERRTRMEKSCNVFMH